MHEGRRETADEGAVLRIIRRLLLLLVVLGIVGMSAELVLLEHWESPLQWIPFAVMLAGLVTVCAVAVRPGRRVIRATRLVMAAFLVAGALGLWLHWRSNALLELEMNPSISGWDYYVRTLFGGTPFLAPGALIQLGLMGLLATYRHPSVESS